MSYYGKTDVGRRRLENQDAFSIIDFGSGGTLYTVCDGMGGANGGQIASTTAIRYFCNSFRDEYLKNTEIDSEEIADIFKNSVSAANKQILKIAKDDESLKGMGTTLVAALVRDNTVCAANVGDSRLYACVGGELTKVSHDHSYVQFMVDIGQMTEEEAEKSPKKNIITRAVGIDKNIDVDTFIMDLPAKEDGEIRTILLCSDGLTNCCKEEFITKTLSKTESNEKKVEKLIDNANKNGGFDNITAIVADC